MGCKEVIKVYTKELCAKLLPLLDSAQALSLWSLMNLEICTLSKDPPTPCPMNNKPSQKNEVCELADNFSSYSWPSNDASSEVKWIDPMNSIGMIQVALISSGLHISLGTLASIGVQRTSTH